jgi:two-component system sensor histidine kinase BaeS
VRHKKGLNLRFYFIGYVFAILCVTLTASWAFSILMNHLISPDFVIPTFIWVLLFSVILGTAATAFFSKLILSPITRLSDAMSQVAAGDFSVRLQTSSKIAEMRETYVNFNLMTQGLAATETLQSDFVSNVSHEFKTPINAIEGYAMLLQDQHQTPEEQAEYVGKILSNTRRLSELVGNILLLSKVDNQAIQAGKKRYRLDEQVRQAILSLEQKWTEKEIEFDVDMAPVIYYGNESLMLHVWTNLIDNAIKFDPLGGTVRIRLEQEGRLIRFAIEDNGPGIPLGKQKHIFDRFYQADSSHKAEGNGLGLALVRRILDTCGGDIQVQNGQTCGTKFLVTLAVKQ